jgi:hypothetical protein
MDFVTGLPMTPRLHDAIVVFVDRLTKMVHLVPTTTTVDAVGTARLYIDHVWKHHGVPQNLVTDRGSVFISHFWTALLQIIGTKQKLSTAYHPQTDGQTERVNRVIEDMLRHYVMELHEQSDWDLFLSAAEFAINNSVHESTNSTPFRLNYGRDPRIPLALTQKSNGLKVPSAAVFADRMEKGLLSAKVCLESAQQRQKHYADQHRRHVSYDVGSQVLLSSKNINLRQKDDCSSTVKLLPRWIGPFTIEKTIGAVAYKLILPSSWRIHPVFHVSLLKPYRTNGRVQPPLPLLEDGQVYYLIDEIIRHKVVRSGKRITREYLIKWLGYGDEHNTWEPESAIAVSENGQTLKKYWASLNEVPPILLQRLICI